jgi:phenylalanyl-tRNA synthetase alpha chain
MDQQLEQLRAEALAAIAAAVDENAVEQARVKFLGQSGPLTALSKGMKDVPKETSRASANSSTTCAPPSPPRSMNARPRSSPTPTRPLSPTSTSRFPGTAPRPGTLHPITQLLDRTIAIFRRMGFALADGPDIETEWHCFDALNTPADHPARNEQDTFYLPDGRLLRTHTSTVQIRTMEKAAPPFRIIAPGAAYRRDEIDATHLAQFTQMEGLYVDEGVSVADLQRARSSSSSASSSARTRSSVSARTSSPSPSRATRWTSNQARSAAATNGSRSPAAAWSIPPSSKPSTAKRGDTAFDPEKYTGFAFGFGLDRLADDHVRRPRHPLLHRQRPAFPGGNF